LEPGECERQRPVMRPTPRTVQMSVMIGKKTRKSHLYKKSDY
jgi:hypothetical protein